MLRGRKSNRTFRRSSSTSVFRDRLSDVTFRGLAAKLQLKQTRLLQQNSSPLGVGPKSQAASHPLSGVQKGRAYSPSLLYLSGDSNLASSRILNDVLRRRTRTSPKGTRTHKQPKGLPRFRILPGGTPQARAERIPRVCPALVLFPGRFELPTNPKGSRLPTANLWFERVS